VLYDVRLDTANPPSSVVCNDMGRIHCVVKDLHPYTTYYWRVVSQNAMYSTLGPVWSFTTGAATTSYKIFLPSLNRP
jgi:hypothetical protein